MHIYSGTWYCPTCQRALTDDESMQVWCTREGGRTASYSFMCGPRHAVKWIAPWEELPKDAQ